MKLLPIDELNLLKPTLQKKIIESSDCVDSVLEILILSYVNGVDDVNESLDTHITPDTERMQSAIYKKIEGKDFAQRVTEYASLGDVSGIMRVAETESHRVYNECVYEESKDIATHKTWHTMEDERVRDTHSYLNDVTLPIDAEFYTYMGNKAYAPGQFGVAEEDVNCRCYLTVGR